MHATQIAYMKAKAAYKLVSDEMNAEMSKLDDLLATSESAWLEAVEALENRIDTSAPFHALLNAEEAMLKWAFEQVNKLPQAAAHRADLERVYEARKMPKFRQQLIDTAYQLSA